MHILVFDTEAAWVSNVTSLWRDRLRVQPRLRLCLTSGNTPLPVFATLAESVERGLVSLRQAEVFALDEYGGLAAEDPGRCANMLTDSLLRRADLPPGRFHCFNPEAADLEAMIRDYASALGGGLDLALLGIGLNGHVGLNEPGSTLESPTRRTAMHPTSIQSSARYFTHSNLPQWGLTVGMKELFAAREVWLMATGSAKAEIVRRLARGPVSPDVPASFFQKHSNCFLLLDAKAAAQL